MSRRSGLLPGVATVIASLAMAVTVAARTTVSPDRPGPYRTMVLDGSPVHGIGNIRVHASNWGAIGSMPGSGTTFSEAPSAEWPAGSGVEYLFVAGLWVGATRNGTPSVSTSAFQMEFRPSQDTRDTVYQAADGINHGARIPFNPDDDRDVAIDEDPKDGFDNDNDGAIDEDFAAIADQMMIRRFRDDQAGITDLYPEHTPMHLEIREESCAFAEEDYDDFVGFTFAITNTGTETLDDVYVGLLADGDVGARDRPNYWEDDATGLARVAVDLGAHGVRTVAFPHWRDNDGDNGQAPGYCGFVLLDHTVDPTGATAPDTVALHTWVTTSGSAAYQDGGDPTSDVERYELMSSGVIEPPAEGEIRAYMSVGPFPTLAPGHTITFTVALVVTPDDFSNVARAVEAYDGRWFDLDHDATTGIDGKEHHEPWYLPGDVMNPVWLAGVEVGAFGGDIRVRWGVQSDQPLSRIEVLRAPAGGGEPPAVIATLPGSARQFVDETMTPGVRYVYTVTVYGVYGASYSSPALETAAPKLPTTFWQGHPNPFRDTTTLSAYLARRADMSLAIFDAAGRRVTTLASGMRDEGDITVRWSGTDDAGRRVPSGVYFARLAVGGETYSQKLLLVR